MDVVASSGSLWLAVQSSSFSTLEMCVGIARRARSRAAVARVGLEFMSVSV